MGTRIGSTRPCDALRLSRPCEAVRKTAIAQKPQRDAPPVAAGSTGCRNIDAIKKRYLDFKELPARSLVLSLSQRDSAC